MKLTRTDFCPLIQEPCRQLDCNWFIKLRGMDPNTGEDIDDYRCTMAFLPLLLVETASQTRQAGAAIESFRNDVSRQSGASRSLMLAMAEVEAHKPPLIEGNA